METETPECKRRIELMLYWVIANEETGDVLGLKPDAPPEIVEEFQRYLDEINSKEPVLRYSDCSQVPKQ